MPANHQTLKYAQRTPTLSTPGLFAFAVEVPPSLVFRRLFLGAHMWSGMTNILWTARIEFLLQGKADGFPLDFGWRSQSYGIPGSGALNYQLTPEFPVCPPFSVETIPTGSAGDFPSAAPAQRDEMIATTRDVEQTMVRNVRMLPIPVAVRCDQIKATFKYYTDGTASSYPTFEMFLGCRSSDYQL
jgi:hypothetical protein